MLSQQPADSPAQLEPAPGLRSRAMTVLMVGWALMLGALVISSLSWRMSHDAPLMTYAAWLFRHGYRPYLDLFDMNMPGTYLIYVVGQVVFGDGDPAFRRFDLLWLGLTCFALWRCVRPLNRLAAWVAAFLLATTYLLGAPWETMQRDWLMLLPIFGVYHTALHARLSPLRLLAGGLAIGFAALIKPQAVLLGPLFLGVVLLREEIRRKRIAAGAALTAGALLPLLIALAWLIQEGALTTFLWNWTQYLSPLYARLDGGGLEHEPGPGLFVWSTLETLKMLFTLRKGPVVLAALVAWWLSRRQPGRTGLDRLRVSTWAALVAYGLIHVITADKHWAYHFWPAYGALLPLMALLVMPVPATLRPEWLKGPAAVVPLLFPLWGMLGVSILFWGVPDRDARNAHHIALVDQLTKNLVARANPGDRVQVLDTTGGGVHAAYQARLEPGSRFMYDFHFFHHEQTPVIQQLRRELMDELRRNAPRFVAVWSLSWSHRQRYEDLERFPELVAWLRAGYASVEETEEYRLYLRNP